MVLSLISALSGIAVFIYGMLLLSGALRESFALQLKKIMSKFTGNRFSACLTGAAVTAAMQSSSASTVMTAALADSGAISVYSAAWLVVGANIGTTLTGLLTAVDFSSFAPLFCVVGMLLLSFAKKEKLCDAGKALMGFGLLFVGMNIMNLAFEDIKSSEFAMSLLSRCKNPISGLLTGALFTAVIQSSAAVTAILQTLSAGGVIGIRQAYYIILGANIGTCATSAIAALGLKSSAKKVAAVHILFNFAGSMLFLLLGAFFPLPEMLASLSPGGIKTQIAAVNIIFNLVSALLALCLPVKDKKREKPLVSGKNIPELKFLFRS